MSNGISQLENRDWEFKKNVRVIGGFTSSGTRYQLEEFFNQRPGLNASMAAPYTDADATAAANTVLTTARVVANKNFEILGTNASADDITFATTDAGILCTLDGADNDQIIVLPHLDANQTAWTGVLWGTENQTEWECAIKTGAAVTTNLIWAGLKLTNTPTIATDDDQVFFRYSTDDTNTKWMCNYSIGGVDVETSSGITVAAATWYRLRIKILASRAAEFYINDVMVLRSTALTNDINFIPYIGIQALGPTGHTLNVGYEKISRILFE